MNWNAAHQKLADEGKYGKAEKEKISVTTFFSPSPPQRGKGEADMVSPNAATSDKKGVSGREADTTTTACEGKAASPPQSSEPTDEEIDAFCNEDLLKKHGFLSVPIDREIARHFYNLGKEGRPNYLRHLRADTIAHLEAKIADLEKKIDERGRMVKLLQKEVSNIQHISRVCVMQQESL